MSHLNDDKVLNVIFNPNTPFEETDADQTKETRYEKNDQIEEAKKLEQEGVKEAEANNLKRSIECFTSAIQKAPEWASSYNNRAQAHRLSGNTEEALQDLNKAIVLADKYDDLKVLSLALTQKGTIFRLKGQNDEALECFKRAASLGNSFAKQQVVALNPYAAMCNKMLSEMFCKLKKGESV